MDVEKMETLRWIIGATRRDKGSVRMGQLSKETGYRCLDACNEEVKPTEEKLKNLKETMNTDTDME